MKKLLLIIVGFLVCAGWISGCDAFTAKSVPTGSILMVDEFTEDEGRWSTTVDPDFSMVGYQADGMRFVVNKPNTDYFSLYKTAYPHGILDVDATNLNGPDNNFMGIVCRYQDVNNYYGFIISSDGYYGIIANVNGEHQVLPDGELFFNDEVINTGRDTNHLRVGCVQSALWLEVNGTYLLGLYDSTLEEGKVGMLAGALSEPGVDILFDNFSVIQP